jgi:hypothetical protein
VSAGFDGAITAAHVLAGVRELDLRRPCHDGQVTRDDPPLVTKDRVERDARLNDAARRARLRADGGRSLGDNLEQADALVKAAFELSRAFADGGG